MAGKPRVAVILGSTRPTRFIDKPAAWLMDLVRAYGKWDVELLDLRDFDLPFFDEMASNLWMPSQNPKAVAWQDKLATFDGFIFVTPEYNRSITGALKNALDQAYKEWVRKPAAVFGYGATGGARAVEHLRTIAIELQMVPIRHGIHLQGADFMAVHPMGGNGEMKDVEAHLKPGADAMLDDLDWWLNATMAARAEDRRAAA
ncbi:FMN reductase [Rhodobacterales bacterium HKCCE2091]|nr:FMN reductase [Rhodobacterales bacterium HKCCE2091]